MTTHESRAEGRTTARISALIVGAIVFLMPWYVNGPQVATSALSFWNCIITGVLIMAVAVIALAWRRSYWPVWAFLVLDLWVLLAPQTLSFADRQLTIANLLVGFAGLVVSFIWIRRVLGRIPPNRALVKGRTFRECSSSERVLFGLVLVILGLGYVMALGYLYMTHSGLDGKPGISVQDIAISYYGNRSGTRLEEMLRGPMAGMRTQAQLNQIVAWLKAGADKEGYDKIIHPIIEQQCARCHSAKSGMNLPDFTTYAGIRRVAKVNTGMSMLTLMKLSHIHLFGIGLVAFVIGFVFTFAEMPAWFKNVVIFAPFFTIVIDIATWFLTKWDPIFAYTVVVAGVTMGLSWAIQIFISLYQLIFLGPDVPEGGAS